MKTAKYIRNQIEQAEAGQLWTYKDFANLPQGPVAKVLSRLAQEGLLVRVHKGIYFKPKKTILGLTRPDSVKVAQLVLSQKKKARVYAGGTGAFYNASLTTQVPATTTLITDSHHRGLKVSGENIRVIHRRLSHMKDASVQDISLIQSLRDINKIPDSSLKESISKILKMLRGDRSRLERILGYANFEPPRVRALVGALAQELNYSDDKLRRLKKSLNPMTKYKLGLDLILPTASDWNIL